MGSIRKKLQQALTGARANPNFIKSGRFNKNKLENQTPGDLFKLLEVVDRGFYIAFSGEMKEKVCDGIDKDLCSEFFNDRITVMEILYRKTGEASYQLNSEHLAVINRVIERQRNFIPSRHEIGELD